MELGWLQGMRSDWAVLGLLAARFPFHIALLFHQPSGSLDTAVCHHPSLQLDRGSRIKLHGPLDLPVLESSFEDIVAELTCQLSSVEFELRPEINWLVEVPKGRNPRASRQFRERSE